MVGDRGRVYANAYRTVHLTLAHLSGSNALQKRGTSREK